jgi:hypothetical protein
MMRMTPYFATTATFLSNTDWFSIGKSYLLHREKNNEEEV